MIIEAMKYLVITILILGVWSTSGCRENKYESGKKYYFMRADYKFVPYNLFNEVEYKYLEDHQYSYYAAIFNEKDNLVVFEKWKFLSKEDIKIEKYLSKELIKGLIDNLYPALYYSIIKGKGVERPNKQIDIKAAEELLAYYRLTFDKEKLRIKQQKITKERVFVETLSYDKKGKLIKE